MEASTPHSLLCLRPQEPARLSACEEGSVRQFLERGPALGSRLLPSPGHKPLIRVGQWTMDRPSGLPLRGVHLPYQLDSQPFPQLRCQQAGRWEGWASGQRMMEQGWVTGTCAPGAVPDTPHAALLNPPHSPARRRSESWLYTGADRSQRAEADSPGATGPLVSCWAPRGGPRHSLEPGSLRHTHGTVSQGQAGAWCGQGLCL